MAFVVLFGLDCCVCVFGGAVLHCAILRCAVMGDDGLCCAVLVCAVKVVMVFSVLCRAALCCFVRWCDCCSVSCYLCRGVVWLRFCFPTATAIDHSCSSLANFR